MTLGGPVNPNLSSHTRISNDSGPPLLHEKRQSHSGTYRSPVCGVKLCDCLFSWSSGGPESFEILVWELKFGLTGPPSVKCELHHHLAPVKAALFVPAPHCVLATASMDRTIALWDCSLTAGVQEEPEICGNLKGHKYGVHSLAYLSLIHI